MVRIASVAKRSRAAKVKIAVGDTLVSVNGNEINDVLDYRFYLSDTELDIELVRDGSAYSVHISKEIYDDIGLGFETPLMDKKQSCRNKCIFCFIDQLPSGMRESLYFKDDDSRLSFLHGNYITLTNLTDADIDRIIKMHISPINISIHTMNPELRVEMMKNKRAGEVLSYLDRLRDAGLTMHAQIVLCKGVNDGEELMYSMRRLSEYYPALDSVSIVPAGLTDHRDGLYPLDNFTKEEAGAIIDTVDAFCTELVERNGSRLFFLGDEFYLKAERDIPASDYYEEYSQIENGVGMLRSLMDDFDEELKDSSDIKYRKRRTVSVATGVAAYPYISDMAQRLESTFPTLKINVYRIVNNYFGAQITVSGLMTGKDICEQLADKELGAHLVLPSNCLRCDEDVFLCGMTLRELSRKLGVKVRVSDSDAESFICAILA